MNTKKTRLLSILFAFALSMIGVDAFARDITVKNSDGVNIYYNWLNNDTELEVTYFRPPGYSSDNYTGNIVIPANVTYNEKSYPVTRIGDNAFFDCRGLTSVAIPNSVTSIGETAFYGCSGLTSVNITDIAAWCNIIFFSYSTVERQGCPAGTNPLEYAHHLYLNGEEIKNLRFPFYVNRIRAYTFRGCSGLTSVTIPNSVTNIGNGAFSDCSGLSSIIVESGNSKYDSRYNCNAIIETNTNTLITGCNNTVIPNTVTSIGEYAFDGCSGLSSITIPNSVTSIGYQAFDGCSSLTSVTVEMKTPLSIGSYTFTNRTNATLYVPANCKAAYEAADYWNEFKEIVELESLSPAITFADANVKTLCVQKWDKNGDGELSEAEAAAVTDLGVVFRGNTTITSFNELQYFTGLTSIRDYAFSSCYGLTTVTIPNSVTSIGVSAFSNCGLTSLTIPKSVTSIGTQAFMECGLTSVTIPNSVTSIGYGAFRDCSRLTSVTIPNSVTFIGDGAFSGCSGLTSVTIPNSVTSIVGSTFENCSGLTSVSIPNSVTSIGGYSFRGCYALTSVTIPNSVTSIGDEAFSSCYGLASVTIGNSVTSIGNSAFSGCSGLTSVTIPNSVTSIGNSAFSGCSRLTSVTIGNSVTSIGNSAFSGCSGLTSVTIPNSVTSIGRYAFSGCSGLVSLKVESGNNVYDSRHDCNAIIETNTNKLIAGCQNTIILESVTSIADYAFYNIKGLTSVTIPNPVTSIGDGAFYGCSGLSEIYSMISEPFEVNANCWSQVNKDIPLYVPAGSRAKYQATAGWNVFTNIIELDASTDKTIAMDNLTGYAGKTLTLPILMNNEQQITGLQFDIVLPEGVTVAKKANGKNDITVTERMEEDYNLSSNTMDDGCIRVTGLSGESIPFTGNSGAIVNVVLQVDESVAEGDYQILVKNIVLSDVNGVEHKPATASCVLTVKSYVPGDVDDSGDININDAVCIVNYILNKPNAKFIPEAADLDSSGDININDAVVLINKYILKRANAKAMKAPRRAATGTDNYLSLGAISIKPGETKTVSVDMTNTEGIQGLQCSIDLPEGLSFATKSNGKIDIANNTDRGDGFTLSTSLQEDGSLTVATVNFEGDSYYGNSGTIFTFKIKADENMAAGEYEIKVCDIVLSSGVAIKPSDAIGKVTVEGSSSGLQQIDADSNQSDSIYNLNGQRVKKPNHGVYIHNGRKVIVE